MIQRLVMPYTLFLLHVGLLVFVDGGDIHERTVHRLVGGHMNLAAERLAPPSEIIITSSAGSGPRESRQQQNQQPNNNDERKTLSQQVADGKYGLIQNELFSKASKRPGVLSYDINPDIPADNINSLGGVTKNDIWLAENHLLVLKGGSFAVYNQHSNGAPPVWPPIDDYSAPGRQVKIPARPAVPPPFPVQLEENGPLQILGTNSTTTVNGSFAAFPYALPGFEGTGNGGGFFYPPYPPANPNPANTSSGQTPYQIPPFPPPSVPPDAQFNGYGAPASNISVPPSVIASLPPGAAILPPPSNVTSDYYDDDDPSIYYPPPYSFYYPVDNTTRVPPGPLVPGIVLPPPPDFFAPLEPKAKKKKRPLSTSTTPATVSTNVYHTTSEPNRQIQPTTTPSPVTTILKAPVVKTTKEPPLQVGFRNKHVYHSTSTTTESPISKQHPDIRKRPPVVTILRPVTQTTTPPPNYYYENDVNRKPIQIYNPPRTTITSTQIPLKAYYTSPNEIDTNSVTQNPNINYYRGQTPQPEVPKPSTKAPTRYYFYEEDAITNSITTTSTTPSQPIRHTSNQYFNFPKDYLVPIKEAPRIAFHPKLNMRHPYSQSSPPPLSPQQQYYYVTSRPYNSVRPTSRYRFVQATKKPADTFSIHVARLKQQIHEYYPKIKVPQQQQRQQLPQDTINSQFNKPHVPSPKPVYQFSFEAANYKQQQNQYRQQSQIRTPSNIQDKFRPMPNYSVQIQQAVEIIPTEPPIYQRTPSPLYQIHSERPVPSKYYSSSSRPDYEYEDIVDVRTHSQNKYNSPRPISQYSFESAVTPSAIYNQPFYTKQDESYFDDITKKYFTIFGKKIPSVTTPLSPHFVPVTTPKPPSQYNRQEQHSQQSQPAVPLVKDYVNYSPQKRPPINTDAEYIHLPDRPRINSDTDIVKALNVPAQVDEQNKNGAFISYELPGDDGAHFYFLTPQLANSRSQGAGFYYSKVPDHRKIVTNSG